MLAEGGGFHRLEFDPQAAEACVVPVSLNVGEEVEEDVDGDDVADVFGVVRGEGLEGHPYQLLCWKDGGREGGREGGRDGLGRDMGSRARASEEVTHSSPD